MNRAITNMVLSSNGLQRLISLLSITLVVIGVAFFYFSITFDDAVVGFSSDDAVYLLMAEHYSPWHDHTSYLLNYLRLEIRLPPLYSVLMGTLGVGVDKPELAAIVTTCCLLSVFIIFGLWIWEETQSLFLSLLLPVIFALLPSTLLLSQGLWSEFLFMCFFYAVLLCLNSKTITENHWLAAALFIGLASLTRSIGIALIVAFYLQLLIKRPKNSLILMVVSVVPFLFWFIFNSFMTNKPGYFYDLVHHWQFKSVEQILEVLINQFIVFGKSWVWLFSVLDEKTFPYDFIQILLATLLIIFFLIGLGARFKQYKIDALCVPVYLLIILIWPYTGIYFVSRFMYPLLPLSILYCWVGVGAVTKSPATRNCIFAICILSMGLLAFQASTQFIGRAYTSISQELMPYRHSKLWMLAETDEQAVYEVVYTRELVHALKNLVEYIPEYECLYAVQAAFVMLHTGRVTGALPPPLTSNEDFRSKTNSCRFMIAMKMKVSGGIPEYYPLDRIHNNENYTITPFMPKISGYHEPVMFLIERLIRKGH